MKLMDSSFSDFYVELEDFEVVKKDKLVSRAVTIGPGGSIHSIPRIVDGIVYFGSLDLYIYAVDCERGKLVWRFKTDGKMGCNSAEVENNIVYMGTLSGSFYALDAKTGKMIWRFKAGDGVTAKPLVWKDRIYFSSLDGNFYCLDKNGKEIWRFKTGDPIFYAPSAYKGKIYFGSSDGNFYCIDTEGKELWRFRTGDEVINEAPAAFNKGVVYFNSMDNNFYAVNAETGKEIWRFKAGKYGNCFTPLIYNDRVYCASRDGIFYALTLEGKEIWRFRAGGLIGVTAICHKDRLYFGSEDGNIYCLDMGGKEVWRFKTSGPVWSPPAVWKDKLYDGSWDCHFYCLNLDGKEIWRFSASDQTPSKLDPPYKIFEMVVKKSFDETEEIDEKYDLDFVGGGSDDVYNVKSEYVFETTYATSKDYGE